MVSLCKFENLEAVFNRSIRLHVLWGEWCKTDDLYQLLNIWAHKCQSHPPDQRVLKESVTIRRWKWSVIENGDTLIAIFVRNNSHDLWWSVIIPLLITSEWSLVYINRIKMGFVTKNHGLNLHSQVVCLGKLNGLYIACYNIWDREWLVYLSRWSVYASGCLDKFHCTSI